MSGRVRGCLVWAVHRPFQDVGEYRRSPTNQTALLSALLSMRRGQPEMRVAQRNSIVVVTPGVYLDEQRIDVACRFDAREPVDVFGSVFVHVREYVAPCQ